MTTKRQAVLFFFPEWGGMHITAWRDPDAPADPTMDLATIRRMVQTAERGKFHGFFLADTLAIRHSLSPTALSRTAKGVRYEPVTLMSALSGCTDHIGLLCTSSTTYNEPYHVARQFASLDHLSGGRAGWNVVTSGTPAESHNFGADEHMDHALALRARRGVLRRRHRAVGQLGGRRVPVRQGDGRVLRPGQAAHPGLPGALLSVEGPLTISRPPQGHPVIAQAGSSETGRAFAARVADVIYTLQADIEKARTFYAEVKELVAAAGRNPDHVKVLPALVLVVGRTQAEADEKLARLDALVDPTVGMEQLAAVIEADLSGADLDGPVPEIPETQLGAKTRQRYFLDLARRDNLTVRQLMAVAARIGAVATTPQGIADHIEEWVTTGAADGFNITFADAGSSLEPFVDLVVPELQRRGVFHADYAGTTLRENLGIPRPANRFVAAPR